MKGDRTNYQRKYYIKNSVRLAKYRKIYYKNNYKERLRFKHIESNYGINKEQYENMLKIQNGNCGLCNKPFALKENPCVDHNHKTGKVRKLLHHKCNTLIGFADECTDTLKAAITYLENNL